MEQQRLQHPAPIPLPETHPRWEEQERSWWGARTHVQATRNDKKDIESSGFQTKPFLLVLVRRKAVG